MTPRSVRVVASPPLAVHEDTAWRGEMTAELRHVHAALVQLRGDVHALRTEMHEEFALHRAYHAKHESRWGPVRWCEQHPFRLAALVLAGAAALGLHLGGVDWLHLLALLARWRPGG